MKKIVFTVGKIVIAMTIVSVIMMLLLAFIILKLDVGVEVQKSFVIFIYIVSTFIGGLIIGKVMQNRKFLWGMGCGVLYFLVVLLIAILIENTDGISGVNIVTTLAVCLLGGTLGGMAG